MEAFKLLFKKKEVPNFQQDFYQHPEHRWITSNLIIKRSFDELLELIPGNLRNVLQKRGGVLFIRSSGSLACSFSGPIKENIVLIYPELTQLLLKFDPSEALAILAHELGHIFYDHSNRQISPIDAQIEADQFTKMVGLGPALVSFLESCRKSSEIAARLNYLEE